MAQIDEKIQFNQPDDEDPDWVVKQCYLLMVAAATKPVIGVDNLWKCGTGRGRHPHPNFGQWIPINMFKCFKAACAFMWCDKKWWHKAKRDRHWDVFSPCLESFNNNRKALFPCQLLMLDESQSGYRPKTSKAGGFPYILYEPRKPVPLGTMFRNGVECLKGIMVCQEVMMASEHQQQKKCWFDPDNNNVPLACAMPNIPPISASAAEVLRQVEGAALVKGGWVSGDAHFGSVQSCVELKTWFDIFSAFIVKHNKRFFPMETLHAVLTARHGKRPAGHWVVATAVVSLVKVIAIAHAWSQKGASCFVSTCGKMEPSLKMSGETLIAR